MDKWLINYVSTNLDGFKIPEATLTWAAFENGVQVDGSTFKTVDTSKYDIVEKKDAKIERLTNEVEQLNSYDEDIQYQLDYWAKLKKETALKIKEKNKELDDVKKEK